MMIRNDDRDKMMMMLMMKTLRMMMMASWRRFERMVEPAAPTGLFLLSLAHPRSSQHQHHFDKDADNDDDDDDGLLPLPSCPLGLAISKLENVGLIFHSC